VTEYAYPIEDPAPPPKPGRPWLVYATIPLFFLNLYAQAGLPGERMGASLFVLAGVFGAFVWWLVSVFGRVFLSKRINTKSLWVPWIVVILNWAVSEPWRRWEQSARLEKIGPRIVEFLETRKNDPEGQAVSVGESIAGLKIISTMRFGSTFVISLDQNPDSQYGLVYFPEMDAVRKPSWVRHSFTRRIDSRGKWGLYGWSDEP
jgi:hypothetical protein